MGIKGLYKFLEKSVQNYRTEIPLGKFAYKKIAIDASSYMFKYKFVNPREWLTMFIHLVSKLRKNDIHCIFLFDSKPPPEKDLEKEKRIQQKLKQKERVKEIEDALSNYIENGTESDVLYKCMEKSNVLLPVFEEEIKIDVDIVRKSLQEMKDKLITVTPKDFVLLKRLLDILQIPYEDAVEEGENSCAKLCLDGKVDAVMSEDSDVLAYRCPYFLTKINTQKEMCDLIVFEDVIDSLEFTPKQFLDFCIMCGTDYNKNIPRVGPINAFKLLDEHKSIEEIGKNTKYDIDILNHIRVREIFMEPKCKDISVKYCGTPNIEELEDFLMENNCKISPGYLINSFKKPEIIIE